MKILNALPISAVGECNLTIKRCKVDVLTGQRIDSYIGHPDLCKIIENQYLAATGLEITVPCNRGTAKIDDNESFIVAQYIGPRLPEGTTVLPSGSEICYYKVTRREIK